MKREGKIQKKIKKKKKKKKKSNENENGKGRKISRKYIKI